MVRPLVPPLARGGPLPCRRVATALVPRRADTTVALRTVGAEHRVHDDLLLPLVLLNRLLRLQLALGMVTPVPLGPCSLVPVAVVAQAYSSETLLLVPLLLRGPLVAPMDGPTGRHKRTPLLTYPMTVVALVPLVDRPIQVGRAR